jgi:hypothetical protein
MNSNAWNCSRLKDALATSVRKLSCPHVSEHAQQFDAPETAVSLTLPCEFREPPNLSDMKGWRVPVTQINGWIR